MQFTHPVINFVCRATLHPSQGRGGTSFPLLKLSVLLCKARSIILAISTWACWPSAFLQHRQCFTDSGHFELETGLSENQHDLKEA